VRAAALFEALSKLKVISGEMTPILPEGLVRTTRGFQLQIGGLDPATGQLNTIFVGFGTKYLGIVQGTSVNLAGEACSFSLELDTSRSLRGTFSCPGQYPQDVRLPIM